MVATITTGVTNVITWMGQVVSAIFGTDGALADLLPIIGIAVAISLLAFGVKIIRRIMWGY